MSNTIQLDNITTFQRRRFNDLAVEANTYAAVRGIEKLFVPVGSDGNTILAPGPNYSGNEALYQAALETVRPQLDLVVEMTNPLAEETEDIVSTLLWNIPGLFGYRSEKPHFRLKNTTYSPIYLNCREIIKYPFAMNLICSLFQAEYEATCEEADVFTGGELAGIYFAAWWAKMAHQSLATARKPKTHGIPSSIDGRIFEGDEVKLVEDLITDGGSKGPFIDGIEKAGGIIKDVFVVFNREQGGSDYLSKRGKVLHSQVRWGEFLKKGIKLNRVNDDALRDIDTYFASPESAEKWNIDHGYEWNPV